MTTITDKRSGAHKSKNINNRKRFMDRAKGQIKENVNENIQRGKLGDLAKGDKIKVRVRNTKEPKFNQDADTGINDIIVPGNRDFIKGDTIARPKKGGGSGKKGDLSEDGSDDIQFTLTKDEFLDILFEDLELPEMVKKDIKGSTTYQTERRGFTTAGNPSNLDIVRSSKNAMGRRIALGRPGKKKLRELEQELQALLSNPFIKASVQEQEKRQNRILELQDLIIKAKKKQSAIPYLDPLDVRYRNFDKVPKPITNAVMFCLMDVSGSMGTREKDIAKRFFLLLYLFLTRKYERVEVVFIRHTTVAQEVDEQTFFYEPKSGGTQISSGLVLIDEIITQRYDVSKTNIYISQASDGENYGLDNKTCYNTIKEKLINNVQYFAYIEILEREMMRGGFYESEEITLWEMYTKLQNEHKNFKARKIFDQTEIFGVFKDLFEKKSKQSK